MGGSGFGLLVVSVGHLGCGIVVLDVDGVLNCWFFVVSVLVLLQQDDDEMLVPHSDFAEGPQPMDGNLDS